MLISGQDTPARKSKPALPRILVVDDHADTAKTIRHLLQASGFEARAATCYRDALTECTKWVPDVLVGDIAMPGKDGYELLKTLRQADPALKAIAISGYATPDDAHKALEAGYDDFLAKPFDTDYLVACIHCLLNDQPPPRAATGN